MFFTRVRFCLPFKVTIWLEIEKRMSREASVASLKKLFPDLRLHHLGQSTHLADVCSIPRTDDNWQSAAANQVSQIVRPSSASR